MKGNLDELAHGSLGRLLLKYSWPALVAMSLNALYAVVDRFYIGQGCGEAAMAGLTLTFPIMMAFGAFGVFVGCGHATLLSIKLGENDFIACEKLLGEMIAIKLLFFFILPPLLYFNVDTVLNWCGGAKVSAEAFAAAKAYLKIVVFSEVFAHLAYGLSGMTRSEGAAVKSMMSLVVGFGVNLVLDPIFIFGFNFNLPIPFSTSTFNLHLRAFGIEGAAWATVIAMAASFAWAIRYYLIGHTVVILRWWRIGIYPKLLWRTTAVGFAPFLQQLLGAAIGISLAAAFGKWAADEAAATTQIASLGVFQSVMILTTMPVWGAQQGLQPILGYNWGAKNFRRVKKTFVLGFWVTMVLCVLASAVQVVPPFPTWLARVFVPADNPVLLKLAAHDLVVSNCMLWTISINVMATTYFQSIGRPAAAVWLSTLRQGVILLPSIWILPHFMADKALAVWLALPISDLVCQLATLPPLLANLRFLSRVRSR